MTICAACAPPGGGRNPVTPRFLRHFSMFSIPSSAEHTLKHIFKVVKSYLSCMCLGIPFLHVILWHAYPSLCVLHFELPSPTLPPSLSSFLLFLRSFIYPHNHWLIDVFIYSLIFFLPPTSPLPPSLLYLPHPSLLLFFSLWHVFTIFVPVFENRALLFCIHHCHFSVHREWVFNRLPPGCQKLCRCDCGSKVCFSS